MQTGGMEVFHRLGHMMEALARHHRWWHGGTRTFTATFGHAVGGLRSAVASWFHACVRNTAWLVTVTLHFRAARTFRPWAAIGMALTLRSAMFPTRFRGPSFLTARLATTRFLAGAVGLRTTSGLLAALWRARGLRRTIRSTALWAGSVFLTCRGT